MSDGDSYFVIQLDYEGTVVERMTRHEVLVVLDKVAKREDRVHSSWESWSAARIGDALIVRGSVVPARPVEVVKKWELP